MTEEELAAAQERTIPAVNHAKAEREAAARTLAERVERGEVVRDAEVALDRRPPPPGDPGVMTREEFDEELEGRANLDIIMGLREVEGAELVRWQISRLSDPTGRKPTGYLCEWGTDLLSTHRIQDEFGAGTYKVVGKHSNGRFAGQRTVKIAEDSKNPSQTQIVPQSESGTGSSSMSEIMTMMLQQNEQRRQEDSDRERREEARDERRRKERMELMTIAAPVVAAIVPALFGRGPDIAALITATKGPTLAETLTVIRELTPQPVVPTGPGPIDTALKLFDKFTDLAPKPGGETGWADVLKEIVRSVGPGLAPLAAQLAAMRPVRGAPIQGQLPAPSAPTAGPPDLYGGMSPQVSPANAGSSAPSVPIDSSVIQFPPASGSHDQEGEDVNIVQMVKLAPWLKKQIEDLLQRAARDSSPSLYAEVVLDSIPENINGDVLLEFLKRGDWLQTLQQFDSRVANYAPWFTTLRNEIIKTGEEIKAELAAQVKPAPSSSPSAPTPSEIDRPQGPPSLNPIG